MKRKHLGVFLEQEDKYQQVVVGFFYKHFYVFFSS